MPKGSLAEGDDSVDGGSEGVLGMSTVRVCTGKVPSQGKVCKTPRESHTGFANFI
jgi:hypothetical protein